MSVFNASCLNIKRDPETGCVYDCGGSNQYEACRQSYYLKQQTEAVKDTEATVAENDVQAMKDQNTELVELVKRQDEHIDQLAQNTERTSRQLEILGITNTVTVVLLASLIAAFVVSHIIGKARKRRS